MCGSSIKALPASTITRISNELKAPGQKSGQPVTDEKQSFDQLIDKSLLGAMAPGPGATVSSLISMGARWYLQRSQWCLPSIWSLICSSLQ